jgi:hypothetical protein
MYFLAWYVLSRMVRIFQHGMYFPEWYVFSSMIFSSMVCIVQHDMYFPAWYVFSSMVCIVYFIQYVICLLVWEAIITIFFSNAKFKVSLMVNNQIIGISCEDLMKYPVSRGEMTSYRVLKPLFPLWLFSKTNDIYRMVYQWCEFKSSEGKTKNLTAQQSNSSTSLIFRRIYIRLKIKPNSVRIRF